MGAHNSKSNHTKTRAAEQHSPLPRDSQPYTGPLLESLVVSVPVQISSHSTSGTTAVTTDVDKYYPMIARYFEQGFKLTAFYKVPGVSSSLGFGSAQVPYEAVFCRSVVVPPSWPEPGSKLLVVKSNLRVQHLRGGDLNPRNTFTRHVETSDLINKIYYQASLGRRLISIEINEQYFPQRNSVERSGKGLEIGVDILLEVPAQHDSKHYVYRVVNVPVEASTQFPFSVREHCDWLGTMSSYLNQGWKLVEMFISQLQQKTSGFPEVAKANLMWFFEKEASKLEDMTPVYEGTVIEYLHKVQKVGRNGGTKLKTDWSGVIDEMGRCGWELACIQETPEFHPAGFRKYELKLMMFFQRKVNPQPNIAPPPYPGPAQSVPTQPPPYLAEDM